MGARAAAARVKDMSMQWKSFEDFIHMGGYGLYVWGSYVVTLAVMLAESHLAARRRRRALADIAEGGTA
jgi:heme exporter protein D